METSPPLVEQDLQYKVSEILLVQKDELQKSVVSYKTQVEGLIVETNLVVSRLYKHKPSSWVFKERKQLFYNIWPKNDCNIEQIKNLHDAVVEWWLYGGETVYLTKEYWANDLSRYLHKKTNLELEYVKEEKEEEDSDYGSY